MKNFKKLQQKLKNRHNIGYININTPMLHQWISRYQIPHFPSFNYTLILLVINLININDSTLM